MNVTRELWLQNNVVMKVVFEVFSTFASTMPVIDTEYLELWPFISGYTRHFLCWLDDIQYDRYAILICLADDTNVCIGGESLD